MVSRLLGHEGKITIAVSKESYCAGDSIEATITFTVEHDLEIEEVYVELSGAAKYEHGEGGISSFPEIPEYHRERKILASKSTIQAGSPYIYDVVFKIPNHMPPTYRGNVIDIKWLIRASCDIRKARDISAELEIPVLSMESGQVPEPDDSVVVMTADDCTLSLSLSRTTVIEDKPVSALLAVKHVNSFTATKIRAELVLSEDIPNVVGYQRKWIEQKIPIAAKTLFEADVEQSFPFDITIPARYRPTINTVGFTANWHLKVIVSRRMHSGYKIIKPFTVFSTAASS